MKKRILSFALVLGLIFTMAPTFFLEADAYVAHTQAEAVAWARDRANEGWCWDMDNAYGCQCVDLILAYYDYLGVPRSGGNACDYAWNTLPAGWSRVYSDPQPGDVIVWGPGAVLQDGGYKANATYGHIGIITGIVNSYQVSTVETNTWQYTPAKAFATRYSSTASCFIRPDFVATPAQATWEGPTATAITQTDAHLSGKVNFNQTVNTTQCGVRLYDSNGTCIAYKDESVNYTTTYVNIWYDVTSELGVTLTSGKTYTFQFYTISNGSEYWSASIEFTTEHPTHSYTPAVTAPTCTAQGYTTYTCACGDVYVSNYVNALDHKYENGVCVRCGAIENPFVDVLPTDYYYDSVMWAVKNDITAGTSDTTFGPNLECTRGQVVTFLWRMAGKPVVSASNPFVDVRSTDYYYDAVKWAVKNGITAGVGGNAFAPDQVVTREQFVTFLHRYAGKPSAATSSSFWDVDSGAYYARAIDWAYANGIVYGYNNGAFGVGDPCLRGQTVTFLYRYQN